MKSKIPFIAVKKFLSCFLALAMLSTMISISVSAEESIAADGITNYYAMILPTSDANLAGRPTRTADAIKAAMKNLRTPNGDEIPNSHIAVLDETDVTNDNLSTLMTQRFANMDADDVGFFFYIGHGNPSVFDGFYGSSLSFGSSSYPVQNIANTLKNIPGKFFVGLFCCFSGGAIGKSVSTDFTQEKEQFTANINEAFRSAAQTNLGFNDNQKFMVMTEASGLEESWYEGGNYNTVAMGARTFVGALGINPPSNRSSTNDWNSQNLPLGKFASDTNGDCKITFSEIANWMRKNSSWSNPVFYPENSNEVLFTYDTTDTRKTPVITDVEVENNIVLAGDTATLTLTCTDTEIPQVYYNSTDINGTYSAQGELTAESLGNNQYRYSVTTASTWSPTCYFEINHSKQGRMNRRFMVAATNAAPTTSLLDLQPNPTAIYPGEGMEYRITLTFEAPCWFDVQIRDAQGNTIRTIAAKDLSTIKGRQSTYKYTNSYYWDGLNEAGQPVAYGTYTIYAKAYNPWGTTTVTGTTPLVFGTF